MPFACRARGDMRIHSSSRSSVRCRRVSAFSSCAQAVLLLLEPRRVVAFPRDAAAAIELEDPAGDVVEEIAIVRHRDDRARVVLEEPLEPGDRFGVEMVGRLVEQQQVGRLQQQPAQRDAAALAARERGDVGVRRRQAQRVHRELEPRIEVPGVRRRRSCPGSSPARPGPSPSRRREVLAELRVHLVVARRAAPWSTRRLLRRCRAPSWPGRAAAPAAGSRSRSRRPGTPRR